MPYLQQNSTWEAKGTKWYPLSPKTGEKLSKFFELWASPLNLKVDKANRKFLGLFCYRKSANFVSALVSKSQIHKFLLLLRKSQIQNFL